MSHFFIVVGEASGDRLGALLAEELIGQGHEVSGWGGNQMRDVGVRTYQDIANLNIMGWSDVLYRLPTLLGLLSKCKKDIEACKPNRLILVDFGSFNLRLAKWAASQDGLSTAYYSPPKIWASRPGRIKKIKAFCDQVIVLFPFEQTYYQSHGIDAQYFGHPLVEVISSFTPDSTWRERYQLDHRPILTILPGSRASEINHTLPIYLTAVRYLNDYQICIGCASGMRTIIDKLIDTDGVSVKVVEDYYNLLAHTDIAITTSGTATLEVCIFGIPQVVGYKTSWVNYKIAKWLITTEYISLVNLIADGDVVSELIQESLNTASLRENIICISDEKTKSKIEKSYSEIAKKVGLENCLFNTSVAICADME